MLAVLIESLVLVALTILNGVFSLSEMAVVSARKERLQQWAGRGDGRARTALELANAPNTFLSTVQIGITLVGVLAGALGGATIAEEIARRLGGVPALATYAKSIGVGVVVVAITYLSLVVGELVPKRIALGNPERVASAVAAPMRFLSKITLPLVRFLGFSADVVMRLLRIRPSLGPPITGEEIQVLVEQGTRAGVFAVAERDMVERVFRLGDRRVSALITPRTEIVALCVDDSLEEIRRKIGSSAQAGILLCEGDLDHVLGVVLVRDLLLRILDGQPLDLRALAREPLIVPESTPALKALELFRASESPIVFVIDEHGGLEGIVTGSDLLEAVIGDISRVGTPRAVQRPDGSWLVDGMMPVDEFKSVLRIQRLSGEERRSFETVGGFVLTHLDHIPEAGERLVVDGVRYEVLDMDGLRIDKVMVSPAKAPREWEK